MLKTLKFLKEKVYFHRLSRRPKHRMSLLIKCAVGFLLVQAVVMVVLGSRAMVTLTSLRSFLLNENKIRVDSLSKLLSETSLPALFNNDFQILQKQVDEIVFAKADKAIQSVRVFDVEGKVVAERKRPGGGEGRFWVHSHTIIYNGVNFGRVEIRSSIESIYVLAEGLIRFWSLVFVAATLITAFLISATIYFLLFVPLDMFTQKMNKVESGVLTERIDISTGDELSDLAHHFDQMTGALQAQIEDLTKTQGRLRSLFDQLGVVFGSTLDLQKLSDAMVTIATNTLKASTSTLMLLNASGDELYVKAVTGLGADKLLQHKMKVEESAAGWVAKNAKPLLIPDSSKPGIIRLNPAEVKEKHSLIIVPLLARGKVLGVLSVCGEKQIYSEKDLESFQWLAGQAAVAIDNAVLHQEVEKLAETDSLTQLYNHRYFMEKLESELKRAERFSHPLTCLMLDIDDFKNLNDTYGHLVGDLILKEVGLVIKKNIREIDIPARYGGEEFTVILPETERSLGTVVAERIRSAFESSQFLVGEEKLPIRLTVTIGVATYPEDAQTPDDLIRRSDAAMYLGKGSGKNKVVRARGVLTHTT